MPVAPIYFIQDLHEEWNTRPLPADLVPWNAHWEKALKCYGPNPSFNPAHTSQTIRLRRPRGPPHIVEAYAPIFPLQNLLCRYSARLLATYPANIIDFWVGLPKDEKTACVLEVFKQLSDADDENENDQDDPRNYSPELTIEYIVGDGRAIFHLLYQIMKGFVAGGGSEPVYIPHPGVDWLCDSEGIREVGDTIRVKRMCLVSAFLWRLFLTMTGIKDGVAINLTMPDARADLLLLQGVKKMEHFLSLGSFCWNCSQRRQKGRRMSACVGCRDIGTSTIYCSSDCQANDWANGDPIPHKYICGRPEKVTKKFDINAMLPPSTPSYKRSPLLEYVIRQLKESPELDYMFPSRDRDYVMQWTGDLQKHRADFLVYRRRAVQTGERHAVTLMFRMVEFMAPGPDPTMHDIIKGQLEDFFKVQISEDEIIEQYRPTAKEYAIVNQFLEAEIQPPCSIDFPERGKHSYRRH